MSTRVLGVFGTPQDTTALVQHEGRTIRVPVPPALRAAVEQSTGGALPPTLAEQLLAGGDLGPRAVTYDDNTRFSDGTAGSAFDPRTGAFPAVAAGVGAAATRGLTPSEELMGGSAQLPEDMEQRIFSGLLQRGVPDPVARGIIANMIAESRLDPGINEAAPLVPGSRGGFGLNQWTGPRRRALEAAATERGIPVNDLDFQLDYTLEELQGPEASAWRALQGIEDPVEAARIYSNRFLRPGIPHMDRRLGEATRLAGRDFAVALEPLSVSNMGPAPQGPFPPRFEDVQNDPQASPTQTRFEAPDPEAAIRARLAAGAPAPEATQAALGEASQTFGERLMAGFEDLPEAFQYLQLMDNSSTMRVPAPPPINRGRQNTGAQALQRMGIRGLA